MSTTLKEFPRRRRGRPPLYDWDSLFDEDIHVFYKDKDFNITIESFRALVHRTANARVEDGPWKAQTQIDKNSKSVAFRFYKA